MLFKSRSVLITSAVIILFGFAAVCFGADSGRIQLTIPSPDPTLAGQKVTFQVIAVNSGSELWEVSKYYIEIEIYDIDKNYLLKTDPLRGKVEVKPSASILAYLPVVIPNFYSGLYYYKAFITNNKTRLASTDFIPFNVNPLPIAQVKIPKLKISGNAAISYESSNANDWEDFSGNISANLVGRLYDRSFLFNLYTISDQDDPMDIYTILFNYYGSRLTAGIGDIQPEFSNLSVYGAGMRGALFQYSAGRHHTDVVGAKIASSEEGSSELDGAYRRMLYGIKQGIDLPYNINFAVNYAHSVDVESSVDIAGPALTPEKNSVAGARAQWQVYNGIKIIGDYQSSSFYEDVNSTASAQSGSAYRADIEADLGRLFLSSYLERINPDYYAFGAPSVDNDRETLDASGSYNIMDFASVSAGMNRYNNNLEGTQEYTTTQETQNGGVNFTFPWSGGAGLSYSNSRAYAEDTTLLDNSSVSMMYSLNQSFAGQSASVYMQDTEFEDATGGSDNLDTSTLGFSLSLNYRDVLTASIGISQSAINNLMDNTQENINSYSLSVNNTIIRDKLTSQFWAYWNTDSDDSKTVDTDEKKASIEVSCQLGRNLTATLGVSRLCFRNEISLTENKTETGANLRLAYSF